MIFIYDASRGTIQDKFTEMLHLSDRRKYSGFPYQEITDLNLNTSQLGTSGL